MKSTRKLEVASKEEFNFTKLPPASWLGIKKESSAIGFNTFAVLESAALLFLLGNSIQSFEKGYLIPAPYQIPGTILVLSIWPVFLGFMTRDLASYFDKPATESDRAISRRHHQFFPATKSITDYLPSRLLGVKDTSTAVAVNTFALLESIALYYALTTPMQYLNMGILIANPREIVSLAFTGTFAAGLVSLFLGAIATIFGPDERVSTPRPR